MKALITGARTESEWAKLFESWTKRMDEMYGTTRYRHDAAMWGNNPATWMQPYTDSVFNAWAEWDVGGHSWRQHLINDGMLK